MRTKFLLALPALLMLLHACDFGDAIGGGGGTGGEGLTGIIVDPQGVPVIGVKVRVYPEATVLSKAMAPLAARADSATTDTSGHFRFAKLPDGRYNMTSSVIRHDTTLAVFVGGIEFDGTLDLGTDTLRVAGSLRLTVRDANSGPLAGAVCAIPGSLWSTVSDAQGVCVFATLPSGSYRVSITHQGRSGMTDTLTVSPGQERDGGTAVLSESGNGGVPANWLHVSALEYAFYIPPELEIQYEGYGIDSWDAVYQSSGMRLYSGAGVTGPLGRPADYPEYTEDTLDLGNGEHGLLVTYQIPDSVSNAYPGYAYVAGLQTGDLEDAIFGQYFSILCETRVDLARAVRILRSVRKWTGPGPAPVSPPIIPTPIAPQSGAVGVPQIPILFWAATNNADFYRVQVAHDSAFTQIVFDTIVVGVAPQTSAWETTTIVQTLSSALAEGATYFWRVNASNRHLTTKFSIGQKFVTGAASTSWHTRASSVSWSLNSVAWSGSQLVAVGDSGVVLTSNEGLNWTVRAPGTTADLKAVAWAGTQWVAVGERQTILTSFDGVNWTTRWSSTNGVLSTVVWTGTRIVVAGYGWQVMTSPDGTTWTAVPELSGSFAWPAALAWNGQELLMTGGVSKVNRSQDGINWTSHSAPLGQNSGGVWWNGEWVVAGNGGIHTSPDGLTWTVRYYPSYNRAAKGENAVLAIGAFGKVSISTDARTWHPIYSATGHDLRDVVWTGTRYVAVGNAGTIVASP